MLAHNPGNPNHFTISDSPKADWLNAVQEELCAIIEASGQKLNSNSTSDSNHQLSKALRSIYSIGGKYAYFTKNIEANPGRIAFPNCILKKPSDSLSFTVALDIGINLPPISEDSITPDNLKFLMDLFKTLSIQVPFTTNDNLSTILNSDSLARLTGPNFTDGNIDFINPKPTDLAILPFAIQMITKLFAPVFQVVINNESDEWKAFFYNSSLKIGSIFQKGFTRVPSISELNSQPAQKSKFPDLIDAISGPSISDLRQTLCAPVVLSVDPVSGQLYYQFNKMLFKNYISCSFGIFNFMQYSQNP